MSPAAGPLTGGVTVTVHGSGFTAVKSVMFAGTTATGLKVVSAAELTVTAPPHAAGSADVRVTTSAGISAVSALDRYSYDAVPAVSSVSPATGRTSGGISVTVRGTGFTRAKNVTFGGTAGTSITVLSATELTVKSPAHAAATIDVRVTAPGGTSPVTQADHYTYAAPPGPVTRLKTSHSTTTATSSAVDLSMSLGDGGSPFVARKDAGTTSTPSGTWTVTVRNTGTSASSGTTQVVFDTYGTGSFLPSAGTGWTCSDTGGSVRTCTNPASVPAGGSLPPLTFPWASLPGYGYAQATATLTNPSDGTISNNTQSIDTPVVEPASTVDVVAMVSDGGFPLTAGKQAVWTVRVQNVGTSAATGVTTVHYPIPVGGEVASGTGWTCTASTAADPVCTHPGGLAAGSALPPVTITTTVPAQDAPAVVRAQVSVDNPSDAFSNDNYAYLDTAVTSFKPVTVIYGSACPDVMVLAVRGSGEHPTDWTNPAAYIKDSYRGAGEVNWSVYTQLLKAAPTQHISLDPIMYPADPVTDFIDGKIPVYFASVASGVETLLYDMQLTDSQCGGTVRYFLTGYSQGAWVVHDALNKMTPAQLARVAGVALFGDSDFKPFQQIVRDNKTSDVTFGASAAVDSGNLSVPPALTARTGSWCYPTDPVCQFTPANINTYGALCILQSPACPHLQYASGGETTKAAAFLVPFLPPVTHFPHLTLTTPPSGTIGHPYTWTATASCGTSCTWRAKTAGLPPGLTFSSTGTLTGTPAQAGTYTFYVTATGSYGRSVSGNVTITIKSG